MAFEGYRNPSKNSIKHEFNIERFAYDVLAYMLRICGFPEEKIPTSSLKENIYTKDDFVMNVGLSALPIALFRRDEWRITFKVFGESGIGNIQKLQYHLNSFVAYSDALDDEDSLRKVQFSFALYNEYTLFLNSKGVEFNFFILPKLWSYWCEELVEFGDLGGNFEITLDMSSDVSESWITDFMRNFAIPYGNISDVSDKFYLYTLKCLDEMDIIFPDETSAEDASHVVSEKTVTEISDISDEHTVTFHPESSDSESNFMPGRSNTLSRPQIHEANSLVESRAHGVHTNGFTFVLQQCLKGKKRGRSQKLEIEDAFGGLNLEKENISPENRDNKRRRKISGKDTDE